MQNTIDQTHALSLYEGMLLVRRFEETLIALHQQGKAAGTCTSVGQEASAVGVVRALAPEDRILTNHRSAGHLLARGASAGRLLAEVMGRGAGYCKGKSGTLHISARELGVVLTSTIVGGELSLATGVALAQKTLRTDDGITACFFGDGAACEGMFHESLNLATVWQLPILYVCENNQWQAYVHRRETMPMDHVGEWAKAHHMPVMLVDGNDVEGVYDAARRAAAMVRATGKPAFLETYTYRQRGHFEPDDQAYVDADELRRWKDKDPIASQRARLIAQRSASEDELAAIARRVDDTLAEALALAEAAAPTAFSELLTDVYA